MMNKIFICFKGLGEWKCFFVGIKYSVKLTSDLKFWIHLWTPKWHMGRGPYISIGLWVIRFYRGY